MKRRQSPQGKTDPDKAGRDSKSAVTGKSLVDARDRESCLLLKSLTENISLPILVIGADYRVRFINPAAAAIFGDRARQYPLGSFCYGFLFGQESACSELGRSCPLIECRDTNTTVKTDFKLADDEESPRHFEISASPFYGSDGMFAGIVEVFHDITDWKLFEKWLKSERQDSEHLLQERTANLLESNKSLRREVEERQRTEMALLQARKRSELLYRVIPSAIFTVDLEKRVTSWNDKAEVLTGYARGEIVGKPCDTFALYPCTGRCGMYSDSIEKPIVGRECVIRTKDGQERIISKNGDFLLDDEGNIVGAVESFEDITNVKKYEEQLSSERDKLKGMLSAMGQGLHIITPDYQVEYQNDVAVKAFGNRVGSKCYTLYKELSRPCENCLMHAAIRSNAIKRTEVLLPNNRQYEISYAPFYDLDGQVKVLSLLRDITEEKLIQAEAMRAVQLASVGELAAGVAHEINNPINGIINYAQIIQDEAGDNEMLAEFSEKIIREGERIATIVSNLLAFARQHDEESDKVDVYDVVFDAVDLIQHQLSKNCVILEVILPDDLPLVYGHRQQLQQVFLNLFSNARYALNQRYTGRDPDKKIRITGEVIKLQDRDFIRIVFEDHGTGIPKDMIRKVFEPFFSTKSTGEGTGLGLSISREIITKHGGFMDVEAKEGEFTRMIIDIPVHSGEDEADEQ